MPFGVMEYGSRKNVWFLNGASTRPELGFKAPEDFRVTGFDNFDKAGFYKPSITTVSHIREEAGYHSMDVLLRSMGRARRVKPISASRAATVKV